MSRELAEQTIAYILQSRTRDRKIRLTWFGGEPLLAVGTIDRICAALREKGVEFGSYLVTNGILVTEELARRMREDWRIERIQVSLDGVEEEYNRRKNYRVAYPSAYQTVKEKIRLLLDAGLLVQIRCNMDRNNADSLTRFVDDMAASFAGRENLCLYFALLHQERAGEKSVELLKKCQQAQLYARQAGLAFDGGGRVQRLKINKCTKDRPYRAVIIGADGQLYNCEHCEAGTAFGNVRDGVLKPEQLEKLDAPEPVADKCRDCLLLPCCTPFSGCPNRTASCRDFFRDELLFDLRCWLDRLLDGKRPLPVE